MKIRTKASGIFTLLSLTLLWLSVAGCQKYLDERNNKSVVIPQSYDDLMALMDANTTVNHGMGPGLLEVGTDDYYLLPTVLNSQKEFEKENYLWHAEPMYTTLATNLQWKSPYISVFVANTVLDQVDRVKDYNAARYGQVKGTALFLRAYAYFLLAQAFCPPFDPRSDNSLPGLPLRTDADIAERSVRRSVGETYGLIVSDLKEAASLLPEQVEFTMRPSQTAAYAALAKVHLAMEMYDEALKYANMALERYSVLMDYNEKDATVAVPFEMMNEETIFFARAQGLDPLNPSRANVDTLLIASYDDADLRKKLFFTKRANGTYAFKGSYTGFNTKSTFVGLTVPELYLTKAECHARIKEWEKAKVTLKALLDKRYIASYAFPDIEDTDDVLRLVLSERRKEMVFRGVRWSDLRRLNRDPRFAKTLKRMVIDGNDTVVRELPPNDPRYSYLIPQEIIRFSGMEQNAR